MDFKSALNHLITVGDAVSLPYLFIEADTKGKARILVGNGVAADKAKPLKEREKARDRRGARCRSVEGAN